MATTPAPASQASLLLQRQLKNLCKNPVDGFSAGLVNEVNIFEWSVTIIGAPDTLYEGGLFNAIMSFPEDYPCNPPVVRFTSEMWHPNVYADGKVESIVLSIISMLSSPNDESPANVDATKQWRESREEFRKRVGRCVRNSQEML